MKHFLFGIGITATIVILYAEFTGRINDIFDSIASRITFLEDRVSDQRRWMLTHTHISNRVGSETSLGGPHKS